MPSKPTDLRDAGRVLQKAAGQIPFAASLAINRTAESIQKATVQRMHDVFEIRKPSFFGRPESAHRSAVKRTKKATKRSPVAELAIRPPGGLSRADIITRHESDRERRPRDGGSLLVPIKARRGKRGNVAKRFLPKNLALHPHGSGGRVYVGEQRTFLIRDVGTGGSGAIFRRTSRRRGGRRRKRGAARSQSLFDSPDIEILFWMSPKTDLTPQLDFFFTANRVFGSEFNTHFAKAYEQALRTAR